MLDVIAFHLLLFLLYAKSAGDILKTGAIVLVPKFINEVNALLEEHGLIPNVVRRPEEALRNIQKLNDEMCLPLQFHIRKLGEKFVIQVEGYDKSTLKFLKGSVIVEPYTLLAVSILRKMIRKNIKVNLSKVVENLIETELMIET